MLREAIVNTRLGMLAQDLRGQVMLHLAALRSIEAVGTVANDMIARTLLERLCRDDCVFIDVGAHIGSVIDGVRRHSRPSAIHAVEAIPAKAAALRRRFPGVTVHGCALGAQDGDVAFHVDKARSGYSALNSGLAGRADVETITVPMRRLDDLVGPDNVSLIKIDVEGAELGVLRGAARIVATSRPTVMFESGPDEVDGFTKADLWRWLAERDYAIVAPNRVAHHDAGMSEDGFLEAHWYPRRSTNYFAIAAECREAVRVRARAILGLDGKARRGG